MKTATISTSVGRYDDGPRAFGVPTDRRGHKLKDLVDQAMTISLDGPSHLKGHDDDDDNNNFGHFIRQVNVAPSSKRHLAATTDPFSSQLVAESFSETVAVPVLPSSSSSSLGGGGPRQSCASFCNYESERRFRESLTLEPSIAAAGFRVSMVVYPDCTKKRFRTTVLCCPRLRPKRFADTNFVQPKRKETRFVSYVDIGGPGSERRWHTAGITVTPRTACSNFVRGFRFTDGSDGGGGPWSEDDLDSVGSSGFLDDDCGSFPGHGDLDLHLHDHGHLGPGDGYRTHLVVGGK